MLGCLLGLHLSRTVEICNSFEIKYDGFADGVPQIDSAFLTQKQEQCARLETLLQGVARLTLLLPSPSPPRRADRKVFPKLDVIGWYSTGAQLQDADLTLQHGVRDSARELSTRGALADTAGCADDGYHREPRVFALQHQRAGRQRLAGDAV